MKVEECPSLRDLGGIQAADGRRVRAGRLIRAGAICRIAPTDLADMGIIAVFDMRSESERSFRPDPEIRGAEYRHIEVMQSGRRELRQFKRDIAEKVQDILEGYYRGESIAPVRMVDIYRRMIYSDEMRRCFREIIILAGQDKGAVLWHCSAGKDRTGVMTALLLRLLGVSDGAIYRDYLYTNTALEHEINNVFDIALTLTGDERAAWYVKGFFVACPCWLSAALSAIDREQGGMMRYALNSGITEAQIEAFKNSCLI